jgi:hypothetical protein
MKNTRNLHKQQQCKAVINTVAAHSKHMNSIACDGHMNWAHVPAQATALKEPGILSTIAATTGISTNREFVPCCFASRNLML